MPTMERSLHHMAWANQEVFAAVTGLPWKALGSHLADESWIAGRIAYHVVDGAAFFAHCLGVRRWQPLDIPESMDDMRALAVRLAELDALMLGEASMDDELLTFADEDGPRTSHRSTVLAQAVHHATEHRAQLVAALEFRGYPTIALDDIDLWAFERLGRDQA